MTPLLPDFFAGSVKAAGSTGAGTAAAAGDTDPTSFPLASALQALETENTEDLALDHHITAVFSNQLESPAPSPGNALALRADLMPETPVSADELSAGDGLPGLGLLPEAMPDRDRFGSVALQGEPELRPALPGGKPLPAAPAPEPVARNAALAADSPLSLTSHGSATGTGDRAADDAVAAPALRVSGDPALPSAAASAVAAPAAAVEAMKASAAQPFSAAQRIAEPEPVTDLGRPEGLALRERPATEWPVISVDRPVSSPAWSNSLGQRVLWMAGNNIQAAELRLDPPELGSIEVEITMNDDQAQVRFVSGNALARDALEGALPRLREMLAEQGLQLAQADVSERRDPDRHAATQDSRGDGPVAADEGMDGPELHGLTRPRHDGMVDEYA